MVPLRQLRLLGIARDICLCTFAPSLTLILNVRPTGLTSREQVSGMVYFGGVAAVGTRHCHRLCILNDGVILAEIRLKFGITAVEFNLRNKLNNVSEG